MTNRSNAIEIFLAGVESVKPDNLIKRVVTLKDNILLFNNIAFDLRFVEKIHIIGAGKASVLMAFPLLLSTIGLEPLA